MSKPPIYPKGYNPNVPADVTFGLDLHYQWSMPCDPAWACVLGLLTIIGDAVRGVPWGGPVESPVLPEVGSVWVPQTTGAHEAPGSRAVMVLGTYDDRSIAWEDAEGTQSGMLEWFQSVFRPATVIPTPTTDGWRSLRDEQPEEGQMCWWSILGSSTVWMGMEGYQAALEYSTDRVWQPVPEGVVPPPPI